MKEKSMAERRRTNRSHVSYIDKSREYYAAHGYEKAYEWATNDDAPFTELPKPLSECKVGVITTSYFLPDGFVYRVPGDLPRLPYAASRADKAQLNTDHLSWAKDETHTKDPGELPAVGRPRCAGRRGPYRFGVGSVLLSADAVQPSPDPAARRPQGHRVAARRTMSMSS